MSVFKKQAVVQSFPAADIVRREADSKGFINLTADEVITDSTEAGSGSWTIGSVVSAALSSGDCPLEAVERAKGFGHPLYFIFTNATCLSRSAQERATRILINEGDVVRFEGKLFIIESAANDNKVLTPYSEK